MLAISKIVMYKVWYDYVEPKYGEKTKLHYTNTNSLDYGYSTSKQKTFM